MLDYLIPLILAFAFLISPILIIRLLLRYVSKRPKSTVNFQFKIPGCKIHLSMFDSDVDEEQDVEKVKSYDVCAKEKIIYLVPRK